ncbi:MAG: LptF/LptG family permease [Bacteroidales bacterium]|nr:LptF/LptG family permease [Bacteroidales bacterium]
MKENSFRLKKLDWYIIKKFIGTYLFCFLVIITVVIIVDISEKIDNFVDHNVSLYEIVFDYYLNFIPHIMNMFSPLFVFITVIFFTSKLAGNSEIIAMLSGGVSFHRLMVPYLVSAAFVALLSWTLGMYVIPHANGVRLDFEQKYIENTRIFSAGRNIHYQISPTDYVYAESFSSWNNTIYSFTLESMEDFKIKSKLSAEIAKWDTTFNGWQLSNCVIRDYDEHGNSTVTVKSSIDTIIPLTLEDFYRRRSVVETLNNKDLKALMKLQRSRGDKLVKYGMMERNKRYSMPFSAFILTIMGVSLSSKKRRGGLGLNIGIGLALSFSYILFMRFSEMFVHTDTLSPFAAIWLPNMIFAIVAVFLYRLAPK